MNGKEYHRKYEELYKNVNDVEVPGYGNLVAFANRDSLKYINAYNLVNAHTILRATLRHPDFVIGWSALIELGLTSDQNEVDVTGLSLQDWFLKVTAKINGQTLKEKLVSIDANPKAESLIENLGIISDKIIELEGVQPTGKVLQSVIEREWKLSEADKDLIVFHHDVEYEIDGESFQIESSLLVKGENQTDTAMAKCVGLPMAIFTKLFLTEGFENLSGVQIPTNKLIYKPVLEELKEFGISFDEK
jgi:saccharopine dehydrogenase-like NADP-dependent oxidoreductase